MKDKNIENEIEEKRITLAEAEKLMSEVIKEMEPHSERISPAGSVLRKKATIGDLEVVVIAKPYSVGIFENGLAKVVNQWVKIKGEMVYGLCKYTQRKLPCGMKLDIFFATAENWGSILAIRTGSADYSHKVLAHGWSANGYKSEGGILVREGERFNVPEEKDLFRMSGVKWVPPTERDL